MEFVSTGERGDGGWGRAGVLVMLMDWMDLIGDVEVVGMLWCDEVRGRRGWRYARSLCYFESSLTCLLACFIAKYLKFSLSVYMHNVYNPTT